MLIKESIFACIQNVNATSDDSSVSKRYIYHQLRITRAELVKQELNKGNLLDGSQAQTYQDMRMVISDISGGNQHSSYPILRSELPLPMLIESENGPSIVGLYLKNGQNIVFTDKTTFFAKKRRRYQRDSDLLAFIDNQHVFLDGLRDVDELFLDMAAFFDDPAYVESISGQGDCSDDIENRACKPAFDFDFHTPTFIMRRCIEIVTSVVMRKLGIPMDRNNNNQPDQSQPQQNQNNARNQV